ncbi:hypothetical protein THASP1DRAFT_5433, partial [Thamnocephalis sphaerospora]
PAIRRKSLNVRVLLPDQVLLIPGFLLPTEAAASVALAGRLPLTPTPAPKQDEAYRDNWRFSVEDPGYAELLWRAGLDRVCADLEGGGTPVGLNANIRLYRYASGQRFGRHYDDSETPGETDEDGQPQLSGKELSAWASLPRLRGGQTVFYGPAKRQVTSVAPVAGMALLHRHGAHCLAHEAMGVASGCKWVLRSDVM